MKYRNYEFTNTAVSKDLRRLSNQVWKLLPMRENNEDWEKQLNLVLIELQGLYSMFDDELDLLEIISKLEGLLKVNELNFMVYRSTVFSVLSLITETIQSIDNVRKP